MVSNLVEARYVLQRIVGGGIGAWGVYLVYWALGGVYLSFEFAQGQYQPGAQIDLNIWVYPSQAGVSTDVRVLGLEFYDHFREGVLPGGMPFCRVGVEHPVCGRDFESVLVGRIYEVLDRLASGDPDLLSALKAAVHKLYT